MSSFLHHYTKKPWIQIYRLKLFQELASLLGSFYLKLFHNCILDSGNLNSLRSLWRIHMLTTNVPIAKPVSRFRLRSIAAFFCQWWSSCRWRSNCFSAAVKAGFTTLSGSPPAMIYAVSWIGSSFFFCHSLQLGKQLFCITAPFWTGVYIYSITALNTHHQRAL